MNRNARPTVGRLSAMLAQAPLAPSIAVQRQFATALLKQFSTAKNMSYWQLATAAGSAIAKAPRSATNVLVQPTSNAANPPNRAVVGTLSHHDLVKADASRSLSRVPKPLSPSSPDAFEKWVANAMLGASLLTMTPGMQRT